MNAHQRARLWAVLGVAAFAMGLLFWMAVEGIPD
jgi:threonine/homoserine efflux transporter RhtA